MPEAELITPLAGPTISSLHTELRSAEIGPLGCPAFWNMCFYYARLLVTLPTLSMCTGEGGLVILGHIQFGTISSSR
jgi:hypothetical protein